MYLFQVVFYVSVSSGLKDWESFWKTKMNASGKEKEKEYNDRKKLEEQ